MKLGLSSRTPSPDLPARPVLVRAAVAGYCVAAALNVIVGAWLLAFVPGVLASLRRQGQALSEPGIVLAIVLLAVATLSFSAALVVLALRLRAGSPWARPALLTVSLLSLVSLFGGGTPGLAVIVLLIVDAVLITRQPVTAWLRAARGLPPA